MRPTTWLEAEKMCFHRHTAICWASAYHASNPCIPRPPQGLWCSQTTWLDAEQMCCATSTKERLASAHRA